MGFEEGQQAGFEEGRQTAMTSDAFALSFETGKRAGLTTGMELGREQEEKRWRDDGHLENGTCRAFDTPIFSVMAPDPSTPQSPSFDNSAPTRTGFDWADDAYSLPIHPVPAPAQPRDFSALRTGSTNPFNTLQRRHARHHGAQTRSRRARQTRVYSSQAYTNSWRSTPPRTLPNPPSSEAYTPLSFGIFAWIWMLLYGPPQERIFSG